MGKGCELEARIKGPALHKTSIQRLLALYQDWETTSYTEQRSRIVGVSAIYRSIDNGPIVMKTKVDRVREEWYTVVLSLEEEVQDMTLVSRYFATTKKKRWSRMETKNLRLDITHFVDTEIYQVEVEMTKIKHLKRFQKYIKYVLDILLDSPLEISRKRYELARELVMEPSLCPGTIIQISKGILQKPRTLEYQQLRDMISIEELWITPKRDGLRVFLLVFNTMVYSIDLIGHVRLLSMNTPYTSSEVRIIDTEMDHGKYYAFDLASPYKLGLVDRLQLLEETIDYIKDYVDVSIKQYHRVNSPCRVDEIMDYWSRISRENVDGMIFVDGSKPYLGEVFKWKPKITVDLCIREGSLYAAHDKNIPELKLDPGEFSNLDDNRVYELELYRGTAKIIRVRDDKPSPNSRRVVMSNIRASNLGNIWDQDSCHLLRIYHSIVRQSLGEDALDITKDNIHKTLRGNKYSTVCLSFVLNRYSLRVKELFSKGLSARRLVGIFMDGDRVPMERTSDGFLIKPIDKDKYRIRIAGSKVDSLEKRFRVRDLDMFREYGFQLIETKVLGMDEMCLSSKEKTLSNMFTSFVMTRTKTL